MTHKLLLSLVIICFVLGCTINDSEFQIKGVQSSPTMVIPLASGDLSMKGDIIRSSKIIEDTDGTLYIDYDTILVSEQLRDTVDIPNIGTKTFGLTVPAQTYKANKGDIVSSTSSQSINMGISPQKLTEIGFKSGTLSCKVTLNPAVPNLKYAALIEVPEFLSNTTNQQFSKSVTQDSVIQLPGYTLKSATATPNTFTLKVTLIIKNNTQQVTVGPGTTLTVKISFQGMDFTYIRGFFGDQTVTPPAQSIPVPAFNTVFKNGGTISFAQPTIDLNVINDYIVPLKVSFTTIEARKAGSSLGLITNPATPIAIVSPTTLGASATTPVAVTNAKSVVEFAPTSFYYQVSGRINQGLSSGNSDYMTDSSKMRVQMHVKVPLYGKASDIILKDTIDIDQGNKQQYKIDSAWLKVYTVNEIPLSASFQFILTDSSYKYIDTLLPPGQEQLVPGSIVDSNGDLATPAKLDKMIALETGKVSKIRNAKKLIVVATLNTSKNSSGVAVDVKFKAQYKIKVKLGLKVKAQVNATF